MDAQEAKTACGADIDLSREERTITVWTQNVGKGQQVD
jgi:hypothetical protein